MNAKVITISLFCSSFLLGCQKTTTNFIPNGQVEQYENSITITQQEECSHLHIPKGQYIQIALPSNPTTGYNWFVSKPTSLLEQSGDVAYKMTEYENPRIGSGGTTTFQFQAVNEGKDNIVFSYLRPWEKDKPAVNTFVCKINVTE